MPQEPRQSNHCAPRCFFVPHTHWDREWYRTYEEFRARLVDVVDRVLDLLASDPGYCFVLDGQAIVAEDYLQIRPSNRAAFVRFCRQRRLTIGPWYVQPDSLLPAGETHVRNLLEGRRVAAGLGGSSRVAYTPDSFGHPAQFPQIFSGFGLGPFVYWRGNGDEAAALPLGFVWKAPDGSKVSAYHLAEGYFNAAGLPSDPEAAAAVLAPVVERLAMRGPNYPVLLLNGIDHAYPQAHTSAVADALARRMGAEVRRGTLDEFARALGRPATEYRGELLGARSANLLPGVWSSRIYLKIRNSTCETLLLRWAEPWAAIGLALGASDERPALGVAWRALLQNQAHDSIGGCSCDRVHEQMLSRFDSAEELGRETTRRILEHLAGLPGSRETPWDSEWTVYVFNPSPYVRTEVVRLPLDSHPWFGFQGERERTFALHPLQAATVVAGSFLVDGVPARLVEEPEAARLRLQLERAPRALEFVARDVPAFGCLRVRVAPCETEAREFVDAGGEIGNEFLRVTPRPDGTFDLRFTDEDQVFTGLGDWEDVGDRGDTYDFDPVAGTGSLESCSVERHRHPNGIETLRIVRELRLPAALDDTREHRAEATVLVPLILELRAAPGVRRVDLTVTVRNLARDHRLRLLFPTGQPADNFFAATTFDLAQRSTRPQTHPDWVHPPPRTFPHQGFVAVNGLTVSAPGLPEAEVLQNGTIAITLLRCVGWLSLPGLRTRPELAGPVIPTPGAQCLGELQVRMALSRGLDIHAATELATGLWAVFGNANPCLAPGTSLLSVEPADIVLTAFLPAPRGNTLWLRLLNPWNEDRTARVRFGFRVTRIRSIRLDGQPTRQHFVWQRESLECSIAPHQLRTFAIDVP